jgi:hypothetical protein
MKKVVLFLTMALTTAMISAQAWSDNFQLGIKGGLNFATVAGDNFDSPDGRTSFYAGLLAEAPLTDRVSLQPEVFYSAQGFDITDEPNSPDAQFQLDYIQVPLVLKLYLLDGLNIQAGPQFGFKINEETDLDPTEDGGDIGSDAIKDFDFQVTAGAEYKFAARFFVQARYSYGLSEIIENFDVHNSVLSAGIGFMF